jgi:O-antigen ligase
MPNHIYLNLISMKQFSMLCVGAMVFCFAWAVNLVLFSGVNLSVFFLCFGIYFMLADMIFSFKMQKIKAHEVLVLLLGAWAIISFSWSDYSNEAISYSYYYAICGLTFILVKRQCDNFEKWNFVGICYLLGCLVSSIIIIYNWQHSTGSNIYRFSKEGLNANYVAYCLATAVPVLMVIFLRLKNIHILHLLGVILTLFTLFMGIALTGCRGALFAYLIGLSIFIFSMFRLHKVAFFFVLISLLITSITFYNYLPLMLQTRLVNIYAASQYGGINDRLTLWPIAFDLFKKNMIFGVGAGSFQNLNPLGMGTHNVFLSVAAELGIIGLFLYLLSVVISLLNVFRRKLSFRGGKLALFSLFLVWLTISLAGVWEVSPAAWFSFAWFSNIASLEDHTS